MKVLFQPKCTLYFLPHWDSTLYFLIEKAHVSQIRKQRQKFSHKGNFGHALLVAGSYGKMGASVLAAKACLRAGVGLLTAHIPHFGYQIMQVRFLRR